MIAYARLVFLIFFFIWLTPNIIAQELPDGFTDELLDVNLISPIGMEFSENGFGFIWEKSGRVWSLDTLDQISSQPIINIREEVSNYGDHGLVNIALSPNFLIDGYIYLIYATDRHHLLNFGTPEYDPDFTIENQASIGRVTRFTLDLSTYQMVPGSRKVLIGGAIDDGLPVLMTSHCTGDLLFAQDGSLMVSTGESASYTVTDKGNASDTYHEQAIADGIMPAGNNVGSYRAMLLNSPMGKLLRIDPETGEGLASNPFFDPQNPNSSKSKIWALGLRNPYKMVMYPESGSHNPELGDPGTFMVGDVGSGNWEELNKIDAPGLWYGWPVFEGYMDHLPYQMQEVLNPEATNILMGSDCSQTHLYFQQMYQEDTLGQASFLHPCNELLDLAVDNYVFRHTRPVLSYSNKQWNPPVRTEVGSYDQNGNAKAYSITDPDHGLINSDLISGGSIIPSVFNTHNHFPQEYKDLLFFVDFTGMIGTIALDPQGLPISINQFYEVTKGVTNVSFSPKDGCMYYVNLLDKELHRVCYGGTLPPDISLQVDKNYGASPLTINFDASNSIDHSNTSLTFDWDFGNGNTDSGPLVNHTFNSTVPSHFEVTLTVTDGLNKSAVKREIISINNTPPSAKITSVIDGASYSMDDYTILPLSAEVSDLEFSNEDLAYNWQVDFYHDQHFHPGSMDDRVESFAFIDPVGCGQEDYWYKIHLTVTDPAGLFASDTVEIFPYCKDPFMQFIDLSATLEGDRVLLDWSVDNNDEIVRYEIEKTDSYLFKKIDEQSVNLDESTIDENPLIGRNFYRVRAVNANGDYHFSDIVFVDRLEELPFSIYPNPTEEAIKLQFKNLLTQDIEFQLYSADGKRLLSQTWTPNPNKIFEELILVDHLRSGSYYYRVTVADKNYSAKILVF